MINIENIYADFLDKENEKHKEQYKHHKSWFSASSAGTCFKKQLLKKEGKQEPPFDSRVSRLLRLGTIVHRDIQQSISDSLMMSDIDYEIMMEKKIVLPDLNVVGHVDVAVIDKTNGNLKVIDIKTCASYKWRMKFGRTPDVKGNPKYNMQLATYTEALSNESDAYGTIEMSLLWYNKDTSALREENVDVRWIEDAINYWEDLNDYTEGNTWESLEPGTYGVPFENWECKYCGFKDIHCKGV